MNTGEYEIRVIFVRYTATAKSFLQRITDANDKIILNQPSKMVEGPENTGFHLCAESDKLKIFVVTTEQGPYFSPVNVIYAMAKHYKTGIILYVAGECMGRVQPGRFHLFPTISMTEESESDAYFSSGIVGNSDLEIKAALKQNLSYLLSLEVREPRPPRERKEIPKNKKTPKAPKKEKGPRKNRPKKNKPRKLDFSDSESQENTPTSGYAKAVISNKPSTGAVPWGQIGE